MYKIAVTDYRFLPETKRKVQDLASNTIVFPKERITVGEEAALTGDAEIALVTPWDNINSAYLEACPNLQYIGLCGTSTANIDLKELAARGIAFSNIVWADKKAVAEFYFMHLAALLKGMGDNCWKQHEAHELAGKTIGIIGLGHVGQAMAHLALAYRMDVLYFSPNRKSEWELQGVQYMTKQELLKKSEITAVCSPTNVEVLVADDFGVIGPESILVQVCGGSPFSFDNFTKWIVNKGNFAIFEMSAGEENYQKYKDIPRVIFSRQVAGETFESNQRRGEHAFHNLQMFIQSNATS